MTDYTKLKLHKNPFEDLTPILDQKNADNLVWAGTLDLKRNLEDIHRQSLNNNVRHIILNWGTVGSGKTYAAYYFSSKTRLKELAPKYTGDIFPLCVNLPKEGNNATEQLFRDIVDGGLTLSRIKKQIRLNIANLGREKFVNILSHRIKSEQFAQAIVLLGDEDEETIDLISRYIYGSATNTDIKKLGLARPLKTAGDFAKILAGFLLCFVNPDLDTQYRLFIWLDETEDLLFFTQKQYRLFSQFLRDLFDHLSEGVTIFLNSTLAEPEQDTIKLLFGEALWSRINKKIRFNEFSIMEGLNYCQDLLKTAQIEPNQDFSPFTQEALDALLEMIRPAERTPREINKHCSNLLDFAIKQDKVIIDKQIVSEYFEGTHF